MWFTCFSGVGALKPDGNWLRWRGPDVGFASKQVNQIVQLNSETYVTIHNRHGLYVLRDAKWRNVTVGVEGAQRDRLNGMAVDQAGRLWIGSSNGLLCWDVSKGQAGWRRFTTKNSSLPDQVPPAFSARLIRRSKYRSIQYSL